MVKTFTDMLGRKVEVNYPPKRIISLVPSQTELLYDLGLHDKVIGITKFCVHPESWFRSKRRVGGTKNVHIDIVQQLQPDLIIANKEENTREQIEALAGMYPTWVSDIRTLDDALAMMTCVGALTGKNEQAAALVADVSAGFRQLHNNTPKRVAYFIWKGPWMSIGRDTFISDIIERNGWVNVFNDLHRYPEVTLELLKEKQVDLVLLSSEPYPFKEKHIAEIKASLPDVKVLLVDGEMFSWYGSRLRQVPAYLESLIKTLH